MRTRVLPVAVLLLALPVLLGFGGERQRNRPDVPVMGASEVSVAHITLWFAVAQPADGRRPCLAENLTVEKLVARFLKEGALEGVRGDLAFVQSIIETGWFRYGGQSLCEDNNYAGLGAVDGGNGGLAFEKPRHGVRAQIQHLRAYADPTVTVRTLHRAVVDPRFSLVTPKGKAPLWNEFGRGNWATDKRYGKKVIKLYDELRAFAGLPLAWP